MCLKNRHWAPFQPQVARRSAVVPSAWHLLITLSQVKSPPGALCPERSVCMSTVLCPWSHFAWGTCQ